MSQPKSLIINSPYEVPAQYWQQARDGSLALVPERRPAGYEIFDIRNNTRRVEPLTLVNSIRERVDAWRTADYPGVTSVTRRLLEHWCDRSVRDYPFYFCQLEAIETLIWWVEAVPEFKQGIHIPGDEGPWKRICNKMATGSGKTTVMAMIITWQTLNALTYPKRNKDYSRAIFIVAPGITVKERLRVLYPGEPDNVYDLFSLCPSEALRQKLNQVELLIENWHTLMPLKETKRSVVKKGAESDEAFIRRVLGKLSGYKDLVIINDEAHHAYRVPAEAKISKKHAAEQGIDLDEATRWIEGLDRIHKTRRIQRCFDLSATPFAPTGKASSEAGLFTWIVSDFGLNDAIEAGLVKTPRVVVRDDALPSAKDYRSKLYHIYREADVAEDLNRKAEPHESLPKLVQDAYTLLGADWREAAQQWAAAGHSSPPVMLTVCNRTETAARIEYYFNQGDAHWPEMHAPNRTLRVDSKVLEKAERGESATSNKVYEARLKEIVEATDIPATRKAQLLQLKKEALLREIIDNVGKRGAAGQDLQKVISVAMLSEGWDAKNVTHIMGLRAFTSQLLCEQVIGRGLRRVNYDTEMVMGADGIERELFRPEYVNVFGVPLSIFQDVGESSEAPPPPKPSTQIESLPERTNCEIRWPNVLRIDRVVRPVLSVDWKSVEVLTLDPAQTPISAELAPAVGGVADLSKVSKIDLEALPEGFRLQRLTFLAARKAFAAMREGFDGGQEYLVFQLIRLVEEFLESDRLEIPSLFHQDPLRKRILYALNIDQVVQHLLRFIHEQNQERLEPVFDEESPIGSTAYMRTWYTTKNCYPTQKSQISHMVGDSAWEKHASDLFEMSDKVLAYAKNDHLGFQLHYLWKGSKRKYVPDFLIRLSNGKTLVLEIKGQDSAQNKAKREALDVWVKAINGKGGFGSWCWDVVLEPHQIQDVLSKHQI
ncbi:type III restriction endonuclease subunit R [Geothermobacter hydrogeniphilus]|uniref:Type III restriction endonuclease subunit R n=1 Tax=Geothermobacter hydrogeniphilus TaxID=1969733 RepID=A0A2K2HB05_9BACT|nr:DEAD/DEAH box helicase family protein [Geothermobacter hydrogeniphilus]PNU20419.1 type III restriction endonuclease subunit R [Geothermobacter hydrogeniphilus]